MLTGGGVLLLSVPGAGLFGELKDSVLIPFAKQTADRMVADRKMGNIDGYIKIFPECKFVWFGDSGQGDMLVGDEMNKAYGDLMTGVYIQDVVKKDGLTYADPTPSSSSSSSSFSFLVVGGCRGAELLYACWKLSWVSGMRSRSPCATTNCCLKVLNGQDRAGSVVRKGCARG